MCYTVFINTSFYASGFLYSVKTHKILLLQSQQTDNPGLIGDNLVSLWSTFGGESRDGEEAQATFARIVSEQLNLNVKAKDIFPIYDYFHEDKDKVNFVFYAEVKKPRDFSSFKEGSFSWLAFSETLKLLFSAHAKQDVIVGERVINLKWRKAFNLQ